MTARDAAAGRADRWQADGDRTDDCRTDAGAPGPGPAGHGPADRRLLHRAMPATRAAGIAVLAATLLGAGVACSRNDTNTPPLNPNATAGTLGPAGTTPAFTGALPTAEVMASGLSVPWGVAFLPDGSALVSERDKATISRVRPGQDPEVVMTVAGVDPTGEGGLLGLAVSPTYAQDQMVYAYYTSTTDNRITRFTLGGPEQVLVEGIAKAAIHNGGRLAFGPDGMLYATTGDAGDRANSQNVSGLNGKILRLRPDGATPADNPFVDSRVWTYGHRNVQGIAWDDRGRLWSAELGQDTFDEVNLIEPGHNYGWPEVEGIGDTDGGRFTNPVVTWKTEEASPSGIAFWRGALYVAALRGARLWRIPLASDGTVGNPEALLVGIYGRLRTVVVTLDGSLWLTTSNQDGRGQPTAADDRILRFPAP